MTYAERVGLVKGREARVCLSCHLAVLLILALLLAKSGSIANANPLGVPDAEYDALVELYSSTGGPQWKRSDNWLTEDPNWYGVLVNDGHVVRLWLSNNRLTGQMPAAIGDLSGLLALTLSRNALAGSIAAEIGDISTLQILDLSHNQLDGAMPVELGNLSDLRTLDLSYNGLSGQMPQDIGGLLSLEVLDLHWNELDGDLPPELGNLAMLQELDLSYNMLASSIPPGLGALAFLDTLILAFNSLTGIIPEQLGNLANLEYLDLNNNRLSGSVPPTLGQLSQLQCLSLNNNRLTGVIPTELTSLSALEYLDLAENDLSGTVPPALGGMLSLKSLDLKSNHLSGSIPEHLGQLQNLIYLGLDDNLLSGVLPSQLCGLPCLQQLHLESNQLIGPIPESIAELAGLIGGSLGYNALWTTKPDVAAFLDVKFPGWSNTQTVCPTQVAAEAGGPGDIALQWTPINYTVGAGYYEVGIASEPAGSYDFDPANRTSDKSASGLALSNVPDSSALYFAVRTVTLSNGDNQSDVVSALSSQVGVNQLARAFLEPDGHIIEVKGVTIAAVFPNYFYVESADRACGLRVNGDGNSVLPGRVDITGTLATNGAGERYVEAGAVLWQAPDTVEPLAVPNKAIGGGDWCYDPQTGAGKRGVRDGVGLNNVGLLIRTTGRVVSSDQAFFEIDDGGGPVRISTALLTAAPAIGAYVSVVGISSLYSAEDGGRRIVLPRGNNDIDYL